MISVQIERDPCTDVIINLNYILDYAGGSYGGYGGMSSSTNPGEPYGSLFTPLSLGSGGSHGAGGGHITLEVGTSLHVDGTISVAGADVTSGTGGGGSGGSILIEAYNMSGEYCSD